MKSSDALFQLVKSLSKSEKRHVRLAASRYSGPKKYMLLFDEIDRCTNYDEESIRKRVAPESNPKQFHVIKNYLFDLLLATLRTYNDRISARSRLRTLLTNIEILYNRGIFRQANRLWNQAEKLGRELDDPRMVQEIIELRFRLSNKGGRKRESFSEIHADRLSTLRDQELRWQYEALRTRIENVCSGSPRLSPEELNKLDAIIEDPLLASPPHEASAAARNIYFQAMSVYHYGKENDRESLKCMMESRHLYDSNPARRAHYFSEYMFLMENILHVSMRLKEYEECEKLLNELAGLPRDAMRSDTVSGNRARRLYLESYYGGRLLLCTIKGEFERGVALAPEMEEAFKGITAYRQNGNVEEHRYLLAYAHVGLGNYGQALTLVNEILNNGEPQEGRSIYYGTRMLELLIHYELGHYDLVESLERSLRYRLQAQHLLGSYESGVLRFFREALASSPSRKERLFDPHRYESDQEVVVFPYVDFPAWIESKYNGIRLGEAIKQRLCRTVAE